MAPMTMTETMIDGPAPRMIATMTAMMIVTMIEGMMVVMTGETTVAMMIEAWLLNLT